MATYTLAHQLDSLLIGSLKNQLATDSYKLRANLQCFDRQPHEQKKDNLRPLQASRCSPVPIRNRDSRSYATVLRQEFQRNLLDIEDKAGRGKEASIAQHECLKWLDSKKPNSAVYICFGSMAHFIASQLKEIATDLEASGHQFIWLREWRRVHGDHVKSEAVEKAITQIMMGKEAEEMRSRAKKLGETTRKAVE
ncbi:hypothetical protein NC651_007962 [Populus alba x Populus x berolinensis]|nr:hypothetical protein NC651_007962 [Populus alba x Populus x berolinensis]